MHETPSTLRGAESSSTTARLAQHLIAIDEHFICNMVADFSWYRTGEGVAKQVDSLKGLWPAKFRRHRTCTVIELNVNFSDRFEKTELGRYFSGELVVIKPELRQLGQPADLGWDGSM
mmetsp:Transcript_21387/g.31837  ORF Transcript_21387/g.31837 Transcript_21387/m.31837 type:complete len:118 (-) Transcript_21387:1296-1649(-)